MTLAGLEDKIIHTTNCMRLVARLGMCFVSVVSSMYLCVKSPAVIPSTRMMSVNGPRKEPCGMPALIGKQSDSTSPIFTRSVRCRRKSHIQHMTVSLNPNLSILITSRPTLWSTWSNAFAKSTKTAWMDWPLSTASCQWCSMSIKGYGSSTVL